MKKTRQNKKSGASVLIQSEPIMLQASGASIAQGPVPDDAEAGGGIVLTEQSQAIDRQSLKAKCGKAIAQHRHDRARAGRRPVGRSTSCGSGILPSRKDNPSDRDIRTASASTCTDSAARDPLKSAARGTNRTRGSQSAASCCSLGDGCAGTTAIKPLIESTVGSMIGTGRGVAGESFAGREQAWPRSCRRPAPSAPSAWRESRICGDPASGRASPAAHARTLSGKGRSAPP